MESNYFIIEIDNYKYKKDKQDMVIKKTWCEISGFITNNMIFFNRPQELEIDDTIIVNNREYKFKKILNQKKKILFIGIDGLDNERFCLQANKLINRLLKKSEDYSFNLLKSKESISKNIWIEILKNCDYNDKKIWENDNLDISMNFINNMKGAKYFRNKIEDIVSGNIEQINKIYKTIMDSVEINDIKDFNFINIDFYENDNNNNVKNISKLIDNIVLKIEERLEDFREEEWLIALINYNSYSNNNGFYVLNKMSYYKNNKESANIYSDQTFQDINNHISNFLY